MNDNASLTMHRSLIGIVLPIALVLATLLPLFVFRDRLPDPLATHWGVGGRPNDSMSFLFLVAFELVFITVPAFVLARLASRVPSHHGRIAGMIALFSFVATVIAVACWGIIAANLDAADWTQADSVGITDVLQAFGIATVVAAVAARIAKRLEPAPIPEPDAPSAGLAPGARAVWVGTARSLWALPIVIASFAAGGYAALNAGPVLAVLGTVIGLVALPFTSLQLVADRHGIRITLGPFGWPKRRIPLGDIRRASTLDVVPLEHGGWGYRGSLHLFGRAAIVLRGGDGLKLDLVGDKVLTVTVDNANECAGLINDLIATRPEGASY